MAPSCFNRYREQLGDIVDRLFERGGNFVATSECYHDTEELLGKALKGRRKDAIIFTAATTHDKKNPDADHQELRNEPEAVPDRLHRLLLRP